MLYERLEREVVPEFYARDEQGIPTAWVARMRESMAQLTPLFSANRTVREYTEQRYLPASAAYRVRMADECAIAKHIVDWQRSVKEKWPRLHFGQVKVETHDGHHVFEVELIMNDLDPEAVTVELYAEGAEDSSGREMERDRTPSGNALGEIYRSSVPAARPATDYTARVIPHFAGVAVPLEVNNILWQR
jgi:starch phosphorylase